MATGLSPSPTRATAIRDSRKAWIARAGLSRTFGGLGGFLALIFLGSGIYLLQEAFTDPLRAQAIGLIAGAVVIALATTLIFYIFLPTKSRGRNRHSRRRAPVSTLIIEVPAKNTREETEKHLAMQG